MSNRLLPKDDQKKTQPFKKKVREIKELFKQLKDEYLLINLSKIEAYIFLNYVYPFEDFTYRYLRNDKDYSKKMNL